ncbi:MAG: helix-hairpin-helix domain-containing protein [Methanobacteriaceae archaeon]
MVSDFKDLKGVGPKSVQKLEDAGYTVDNIKDATVEDLAEMGIEKSIAHILLDIEEKADPGSELKDTGLPKFEDNDNIIITSEDPAFIEFAKRTPGYKLE